VGFHALFDESVTGLEVGGPVRYRGVGVGTVERVAVAQDGRLIDVTLAVRTEEAWRLQWHAENDNGMRAELESQGLTGVKLVNVDFFDPKEHPPPALPSAPPPNYIPTTGSTLAAIEKSVGRAADAIPDLAVAIRAELTHLDAIFTDFDGQRIPARLATTLDGVTSAIARLSIVLRSFDNAKIPEKTSATLAHLDQATSTIARIMERIDGDAGLIASAQRATEAVSELGNSTSGASQDLDRTLRDLGEAARAVRAVADSLERDPDRLLKGPAKAKSR
jgi:paraquat-inducible protein B